MMNNKISKVAAIQDLASFGRCSLSVIIPILSHMGVQVCPVPTAVFSTHTGGFGKPVFEDLTGMMHGYIEHWKTLDLKFDCIYSGFLSNEKQIDEVLYFFNAFGDREGTLIAVDPVMGDHGQLYKTYNETMQKKMRHLVSRAHVVTPNWTEANFLLDRVYSTDAIKEQDAKEMIKAISDLGPSQVVLKGIPYENGQKINMTYDRAEDSYCMIPYEEVPSSYPGTGDCFASRLIGELLKGESLADSAKSATSFVTYGVKVTYEAKTDTREGILLEQLLDF